jgi:hypothetical protein
MILILIMLFSEDVRCSHDQEHDQDHEQETENLVARVDLIMRACMCTALIDYALRGGRRAPKRE